MTSNEVRTKYLNFFKNRGHAVIPSASLVPENDPTTLFTGSGMQPLLPYLLGQSHPQGTRLVNSQKSFRAEDIEEVGDNRHTTFFEMLGNWSLGDYFKKEQLPWFFEFLTEEIGISKERLWATCFEGDEGNNIPRDTESADIWKELGIPESRIRFYDSKKNWWSRSGTPENMPAGEPGGPDSEMFYEFTSVEHDPKFGKECHPNCDCGRFMEIGNSVFMEYVKKEDGSFEKLSQKNVDFGGGLERIVAASNDDPDIFKVDSLQPIISKLEELSGKSYQDTQYQQPFRIIADHFRGAVFMINDGIIPSNTDSGYILRRILRRAIRHADKLGIPKGAVVGLLEIITEKYLNIYIKTSNQAEFPLQIILQEEEKFRKTLGNGIKEFNKRSNKGEITGEDAFILFTTFGFPYELTKELAYEKHLMLDEDAFNKKMKEHKELSRVGAEQKFKGGLADSDKKTTMLHTTTHLLLAGLRKYLGKHVHQAGSNITKERTRFDFTHPEKVDRGTLDKVEKYVNEGIAANAEMVVEEVSKEEARSSGVEGSFWERYPNVIQVYTLKDAKGTVWSRELCGGPHVKNTGDIKGTFKIVKEESSSAGVRRIKAILE